jgi:hypothetical protein
MSVDRLHPAVAAATDVATDVAAIAASAVVALVAAGCGGPAEQLSVAHRHAPNGESRIVVMPVELADDIKIAPDTGTTLAALYATELLRSYEILDFRRFQKAMAAKSLDLDTVLGDGSGAPLADELGIDGVLLSRVYAWQPGKPGILFLAKPGRIGFSARLLDLRSGSVIWSANRVKATEPGDSLPVGLALLFQDLAAEMPSRLASY